MNTVRGRVATVHAMPGLATHYGLLRYIINSCMRLFHGGLRVILLQYLNHFPIRMFDSSR
jgi:hypothetical protein